ncbi:MAG: hypothetical protein DRR08_30145 [Candidatus Parabeggiatoa sp. nov. 2]|nr:MAG: hypothetical protein B6247_29310 [Beggiatoa sp. 4572_84]RKZ50592.1 MAG: hypothetical protein DRR08_30145 [Gammaproteobacteria bacterium]
MIGSGSVPFIFLALLQNFSAKSSRIQVGANKKFHFYKKLITDNWISRGGAPGFINVAPLGLEDSYTWL